MGPAPEVLMNWGGGGGWVLSEVPVCVQVSRVKFSVSTSVSCSQNCAHPNTKCEVKTVP